MPSAQVTVSVRRPARWSSLASWTRAAAAAGLLGVVHRDVGVHHQLGGGAQDAGLDRRDADARRHLRSRDRSSSTDAVAARSSRAGPSARPGRGRARSRRQDDRELVAAEAGDHVGVAQPLAQGVRRRARSARRPIAWPSVSLTYLKLSRSSISTRAPAAVALGVGHLAVELVLEAPAVEEPGERVVVGEVGELRLELRCAR